MLGRKIDWVLRLEVSESEGKSDCGKAIAFRANDYLLRIMIHSCHRNVLFPEKKKKN